MTKRMTLYQSFFLGLYQLKAKNEGTILGFFWYLLEPVCMFLLFVLLHNSLHSNIPNYFAHIIIGILIIHYFQQTTQSILISIIAQYPMLQTMKIKPQILIFSRFFSATIQHIFCIVIASIFLVVAGYNPFGYLFIFPLLAVFSLSVGIILAIISTRFFDLQHIWNYICQLLWFVTPIFYAKQIISFPLTDFLHSALTLAIIPISQLPQIFSILAKTSFFFQLTSILIWTIVSATLAYIIFQIYKKQLLERK